MRDKPADLTGPIPWVRIEDFNGMYIQGSKSRQGVTSATVSKMALKVFPPGTVLCSCSCSMGATAIATTPLVSNQTFIGVTPHAPLDSRYLYYMLASAASELQIRATGAIQQYLSRNDFSTLRVPLPSLGAQRAIADCLDSETARIDALIDRKTRFIDLLLEKRTALITHAVTKGLNLTAEMKDSGNPWLGLIPSQWRSSRLKYLASGLRAGPFGTALTERVTASYGDVPVVAQRNVIDANFETFAQWVDAAKADELAAFSVRGGDVLVTARGTIGRIAVVPDGITAVLRPELIRFRASGVDLGFLTCCFSSSRVFYDQLAYLSDGATIEVIYTKNLRQILLPLPATPQEQAEITEYLHKETAKVDLLVKKTRKSVDLLREYRTALISAAVTGQIDIPETTIPEEVA